MAKNKKVVLKEVDSIPLEKYLSVSVEPEAKTVRAPEKLWIRVEGLATLKGCSVNALIVAMMEKICDEEGILR